MRYMIIVVEDIIALEKSVRSFINKGWVPIGGLAIDNNGKFFQAVIKEKKVAEPLELLKRIGQGQ